MNKWSTALLKTIKVPNSTDTLQSKFEVKFYSCIICFAPLLSYLSYSNVCVCLYIHLFIAALRSQSLCFTYSFKIAHPMIQLILPFLLAPTVHPSGSYWINKTFLAVLSHIKIIAFHIYFYRHCLSTIHFIYLLRSPFCVKWYADLLYICHVLTLLFPKHISSFTWYYFYNCS